MKKKTEKVIALCLTVLCYGSVIGLGLWRVMRGETAAAPSLDESKKPRSQGEKPKLESLSRSTPGDAPLDRLARQAAREKREMRQPQESLNAPVPPGSTDPRPPESQSVAGLLDHQALESYRLAGWNVPRPQRLPIPTYAPAVMALGVVIFAMGLATVWYVCVVGSLVFTVAAWRWVGELQGE